MSAIIRNLKTFYAVYKNKLYNGAFYFSHCRYFTTVAVHFI